MVYPYNEMLGGRENVDIDLKLTTCENVYRRLLVRKKGWSTVCANST